MIDEEEDYEMDDDGDGYEPDNVYVKPAFITKDEIEKMKALGQFKELEEYDIYFTEAEQKEILKRRGSEMANTEFKEIMTDAKAILDAQEKLIAEKQAKAEAEWAANPDNKVEEIGTLGEPNAKVLEFKHEDRIDSILMRLSFIKKLTEDEVAELKASYIKYEQQFKKVG